MLDSFFVITFCIFCSHLLKIVLCEFVSDAEQFSTRVCVGESPDAQTVGWIQLSLEEFTAGLLDLSQLEEAGSREQRLDVPLLHSHLGGADPNFRHVHMFVWVWISSTPTLVKATDPNTTFFPQ